MKSYPISRPSALLLSCMLLSTSPTLAAQWSLGPPLSTARFAPGVVRHGGDIYAVGGFTADTSLEVLRAGAGAWTPLAPLPIGQAGLAAAVVGGRIYTFGSYGSTNTCQIYDIATDTWQAGPPLPLGLYWSTAEAVGTVIYLIGGFSNGQALNRLFTLDTTTNTWSSGAPMPAPIQIPAAARHGQFIYVFGRFGRYFKYDLAGGTWSTFTAPPSGHGDGSEAVSTGNVVYFLGGNTGNIFTAYSTVELYHPPSDTWLTGPSLMLARYQRDTEPAQSPPVLFPRLTGPRRNGC